MKAKKDQFKEKLINLLEEEMRENEGDDLSYVAFAVAEFCNDVAIKMNEELEKMMSSSRAVH